MLTTVLSSQKNFFFFLIYKVLELQKVSSQLHATRGYTKLVTVSYLQHSTSINLAVTSDMGIWPA